MDNILVYHRPFAQSQPQNPSCEFHSKKIRRQKTVGMKGLSQFEMNFPSRRFTFMDGDPLGKEIIKRKLDFIYKQQTIELPEQNEESGWKPLEDAPF